MQDGPMYLFLSVGALALFAFLGVSSYSESRRRERDAFYRSETLKKIAESPEPSARAALDYMRQEQITQQRKKLEGLKLGGLVTVAAGVSMMFLHIAGKSEFILGAIPLMVGLALLVYAYLLPPKEPQS